jgi:ribonuclease P protein component
VSRAPEASGPERRGERFPKTARLLRHSDFERVYQDGRRHFSANLTVFYLQRREAAGGARVGFTVSKALGGAVERNRMKRRLREAVRRKLSGLELPVDVVINPKRSLLAAGFERLLDEVERAFAQIRQKAGEAR